MSFTGGCPRCRSGLEGTAGLWGPANVTPEGTVCAVHGPVVALWRPGEVRYPEFVDHLALSAEIPTLIPWPLPPRWSVTDFGVVVQPPGSPLATVTVCSGTSELDGPVDVFVVNEEIGTGLGGRCAGIHRPDAELAPRAVTPDARVRVETRSIRLWSASTSEEDAEFDRSVLTGEAFGRWLWLILRPASAILLLREEWTLRDVSGIGPALIELPFGGPRPIW